MRGFRGFRGFRISAALVGIGMLVSASALAGEMVCSDAESRNFYRQWRIDDSAPQPDGTLIRSDKWKQNGRFIIDHEERQGDDIDMSYFVYALEDSEQVLARSEDSGVRTETLSIYVQLGTYNVDSEEWEVKFEDFMICRRTTNI